MNYQERIIRDPEICGGRPVFKGTRFLLRTVPAGLAAGETIAAILAGYPSQQPGGVQAAIAVAAASAEEDLPRSSNSTPPIKV
jgi:uncharacterized protein (DUF433 family)